VTRLLSIVLVSLLLSTPALAQSAPSRTVDVGRLDNRVGKLESEMRAVQRKVFPGGSDRFFEPEISTQAAAAPAPAEPPTTTPLNDLTARVGALEGQLRTMTGQVEAMEYRLRQMEDAQRRMKGDMEFRLNALENPGGVPSAAAGAAPGPASPPAVVATPPAAAGTKPPAASALPATATPQAAAAPTAVTAWTSAFAKVTARDWPGAEVAMTAYIADWPKSVRVPQARYWLGRSFAQRGQHAQAAKAFLDVYQTAPRSTPAPDALIGLANSLNALAKASDACQVLGELASVYGAKLTSTQKADVARQRVRAKCDA